MDHDAHHGRQLAQVDPLLGREMGTRGQGGAARIRVACPRRRGDCGLGEVVSGLAGQGGVAKAVPGPGCGGEQVRRRFAPAGDEVANAGLVGQVGFGLLVPGRASSGQAVAEDAGPGAGPQ
jgi:hypothetical protein